MTLAWPALSKSDAHSHAFLVISLKTEGIGILHFLRLSLWYVFFLEIIHAERAPELPEGTFSCPLEPQFLLFMSRKWKSASELFLAFYYNLNNSSISGPLLVEFLK